MNAIEAYEIQCKLYSEYMSSFAFDSIDKFDMTEYLDAVEQLSDEESIKLFNIIIDEDNLRPNLCSDITDTKMYSQYSLKLLVDSKPNLLNKLYKKAILEFRLWGRNNGC